MPEPTQLRIPRGRVPTRVSRLQTSRGPASAVRGAEPAPARLPSYRVAKVISHLAQEGAIVSFASFPEFLFVKSKASNLWASCYLRGKKQIYDLCTTTGQAPHSWLRKLLTILSYYQSNTMLLHY